MLISRADVEKLGEAIECASPLDAVRLSELRPRLERLRALKVDISNARMAFDLAARFGLDLTSSKLNEAGKVAKILRRFTTSEGSAGIFLTNGLLSDAAPRLAAELHGQSEEMREERQLLDEAGLKRQAIPEDADMATGRAATLAETGWFGRLFGKAFREASKFKTDAGLDQRERSAAAEILGRYGELLSIESRFAEKLSNSGFVADGSDIRKDVDTGELVRRVDEARSAWADLASLDQEKSLSVVFGASGLERRTLTHALGSIAETAEIVSGEFGEGTTLEEAGRKLEGRIAAFGEVVDRADDVGLLEEAWLVLDGEPIDRRLQCFADLDDRLAGPKPTPLAWIEDAKTDLAPLEAAKVMAAAIEEAPPLASAGVCHILGTASAPVERWRTIREGAKQLANGIAAWREANNLVAEKCGVCATAYLDIDNDACTVGDADDLMAIADDTDGRRGAAKIQSAMKTVAGTPAGSLLDFLDRKEVDADHLEDLFKAVAADHLLLHFVGEDGSDLAQLNGMQVEKASRRFRELDSALHKAEAKRILLRRLGDNIPKGNDVGPKRDWTDLALIENEANKRARHIPVRDLTRRAGRALQAMKPLWMMSPGSIAQYISPGAVEFDLLIVDEASQMKTEFAASAILRSRQLLIVGDSEQLPPTDFFDASADVDDDDGMDVDQESILDLAENRLPKRKLKWHYRSQHENLIAYSNRNFYNNDLVVFPTPNPEDELLGVRHIHVGGTYRASINEDETQRIVEEGLNLMIRYPDESLGIVAMNVKQAELIRNEMEELELKQPAVARYVDHWSDTLESFFVKNLENVQGDERDIILVSMVYGPDENGNVMQRFGPINRPDGGRRLNVLASRAKKSLRVFTSLRPNDIKATLGSSAGVLKFHAFITQISGGAFEDDPATENRSFESDFERMVAERLERHGYSVDCQIGVAGFRIDLGVRHPDVPAGYIAGIECDGATYHSARSVRDRDQIRQSVLENLGWNIHRIWSTDWWRDPDMETAKMHAKLSDWAEVLSASGTLDEPPEDSEARTESADTTAQVSRGPVEDSTAPSTAHDRSIDMTSLTAAPASDGDEDGGEPAESSLKGKRRKLDRDIHYVEVHAHQLWVVVDDNDRRLGEVECTKSPAHAARIYDGSIEVDLPEYDARPISGDLRKERDLYAALRHVHRVAMLDTS